MSPIQQLFLGQGAVAKKTYVDDVFSTYLWTGNSSTRTIATGLDMSGEGGMVAIKSRSHSQPWVIGGTGLGDNHCLAFDTTGGKDNQVQKFKSLTSTGFEIGNDHEVNSSSDSKTYGGFSFRKAKGFFDVVTYTGSSSARTISHNLGCVPGAIFIKKLSGSDYWAVYHEGLDSSSPEDYYVKLNTNDARIDDANFWNDTKPTASVFSLGDAGAVNSDGHTYVAYLWAGGESTAATATSVRFGGNYHLNPGTSSDFTLGTGDYTIEFWWKQDHSSSVPLFDNRTTGEVGVGVSYDGFYIMALGPSSGIRVWWNNEHGAQGGAYLAGVWNHCAVTRSSNVTRIFINGELVDTESSQTINCTGNQANIGGNKSSGTTTISSCASNTNISNFRLIKGTALYTSSFRPTTEPLTNVTNTKLLCCQGSTTTAATVAPNTITAVLKSGESGTITASSNSAFDDPAGFVFGDAGDQNVIKCGSYTANSDYDVWNNTTIELGWEPSFVMYKNASNTGNWEIFDTMRGFLATADDSAMLEANTNDAEEAAVRITMKQTGFQSRGVINTGDTVIYLAIRRPDGYCGKLAELGTDVFAMDSAASDEATIPNFDSGFPVDFALSRKPATADSWMVGNRLLGTKFLYTENNDAEATESDLVWDSNVGIYKDWPTSMMGWMWKRHAGFDVVTTKGGQNKRIAHSLNKIPEMYWVKNRDATENWTVYHKGLNGGGNPENRYIVLNSNGGESGSDTSAWNSFVPTSTHISFGSMDTTGGNSSHNYLVLLFATTDVSKVGVYAGSNSAQSINCGFQPRFVIIKNENDGDDWLVFDTTRGWGSGDDKRLKLNDSGAQSNHDVGAPTSTGFDLIGNVRNFNQAGRYYIFYAHA